MRNQQMTVDQWDNAHFLKRHFLHLLIDRLTGILRRSLLSLIKNGVEFRRPAFLNVDGHAALVVICDEIVWISKRAQPIHGRHVKLAWTPDLIPIARDFHAVDLCLDTDCGKVRLNDWRHAHHRREG